MFLINIVWRGFLSRGATDKVPRHILLLAFILFHGARLPLGIANGLELSKLFYGICKFMQKQRDEFMALNLECSVELTNRHEAEITLNPCWVAWDLLYPQYQACKKNMILSFFSFEILACKTMFGKQELDITVTCPSFHILQWNGLFSFWRASVG